MKYHSQFSVIVATVWSFPGLRGSDLGKRYTTSYFQLGIKQKKYTKSSELKQSGNYSNIFLQDWNIEEKRWKVERLETPSTNYKKIELYQNIKLDAS